MQILTERVMVVQLHKCVGLFGRNSTGVNLIRTARYLFMFLVLMAIMFIPPSVVLLATAQDMPEFTLGSAGIPATRINDTSSLINLDDAANVPSSAAPEEGGGQIELANLPVYFVPNLGQVDEAVSYYAAGADYSFYLTPEGVTYAFTRVEVDAAKTDELVPAGLGRERDTEKTAEGYALKITFAGANPAVVIEGQRQKETKVNYFVGSDESSWQTDIPTFEQVVYRGLYPGIDLTYQGHDGMLKYEFVVAPGADPSQIEMVYRGADSLEVDEAGDLIISTPWGDLKDHKPLVYQLVGKKKVEINADFAVKGTSVGFTVGSFDQDLPLIIDPGLVYSTFLGGNNKTYGISIAADAGGCAYVTGSTYSTDFPTTEGAYCRHECNSDEDFIISDVFVAKFNPAGGALVYATYLGGHWFDDPYSIAVDSNGCAYITGITLSSSFPTTTGAYCERLSGIEQWSHRAFVTKINPNGNALVYSTYLGGRNDDKGTSIAVDSSGCAYVAGVTDSRDFPTTDGAYNTEMPISWAFFVTKFNSTGSALVYSTFLGSRFVYADPAIAVDASGCVYMTGRYGGHGFETTAGAYCENPNGGYDAFVAKLNPSGDALVYGTYLGGSELDEGSSIAVDSAGCAYITGTTKSTDFPTTYGACCGSYNGGYSRGDAFVAKFNPNGSEVIYASYLGGSSDDEGLSIAVDSTGSAYITGRTKSKNFPTTDGAYCTDYNGGQAHGDVFVAKFNPSGSDLVYGTYLGGSCDEWGCSIAVDSTGSAYITGRTESTDFPTTPGAYCRILKGDHMAFVAKLDLSTATPPQIRAENLSVSNNNTPFPRLSWVYRDSRGLPMKSYRVFVYTSNGELLWDSGNVTSKGTVRDGTMVEVDYAGGRLDRGVSYVFKVRVSNGLSESLSDGYHFSLAETLVYNPYEGVSWNGRMMVQLHAHYICDLKICDFEINWGKPFYEEVMRKYERSGYSNVFYTEHSMHHWATWLNNAPGGKHHMEVFNEVECTGVTHMLALGITELVTPYGIPTKDRYGNYEPDSVPTTELSEYERVNQIIRQSWKGGTGALAIPAHPNAKKYPWSERKLRNSGPYQAIEIYSGALAKVSRDKFAVATDKWDMLLRNSGQDKYSGRIVWGVATDDYTPGPGLGLVGHNTAAIAIPCKVGNYRYDPWIVLDKVRRGEFYATTGTSGPKMELHLNGNILTVNAPAKAEVTIFSQEGKKEVGKANASGVYTYQIGSNDEYIRVEVHTFGNRSWSQPIFLHQTGKTTAAVKSGEPVGIGLHDAAVYMEGQDRDLDVNLELPEERRPPGEDPGEEIVGAPYYFEIEGGDLTAPAEITLSFAHHPVIPYHQPRLAVYHLADKSAEWIRLDSTVDREQREVTANVEGNGWYVLGIDEEHCIVLQEAGPALEIESPFENDVLESPFNLAASITSDTGVWKVDFYLSDIWLGYDIWPDDGWAVEIDPVLYAGGDYMLTAVAEDMEGHTAETSIMVNLLGGTAPPEIAITSPAAGVQLGAGTLIEGTFSTDAGLDTIAAGIGDEVLFEVEVEGNSWRCNATGDMLPRGSYDLWAEVWDVNGNAARAVLPVQVGAVVGFAAPSSIVSPGVPMDFWLNVAGLEGNLGSAEFTLVFDPEQVVVVEVLEEGYLSTGDAETELTFEVNQAAGTLAINTRRLGQGPAPGPGGCLAAIRLAAKEGATQVSLDYDSSRLLTPGGGSIDHDRAPVTLTVNAPPAFRNIPGTLNISVDRVLTFGIDAVDPDGDDLAYMLKGGDPALLSQISLEASSGLLTWPEPSIGTHEFAVMVGDEYHPFVETDLIINAVKYGSVKCEGSINVGDAILLLRHIVGLTVLEPLQQVAGDVNGDRKIDVADAILILRRIVGLIDQFPVEME